jgi:stalled ribosome rescue protein Dom34
MKVNGHPKTKIQAKKIQWHRKTNNVNYNNIETSMGVSNGLYHHIELKTTTQVKLISHFHQKS